MNFQETAEMCFRLWKHALLSGGAPLTVVSLGPPGTGKTTTGRYLAEMMTGFVQGKKADANPALCEVLDLSSMLPEDLVGIPWASGDVTRYLPQEWLSPLCEKGAYGVLVFDDLPAAASQVQVACRQAVLERRIHHMRFARGVFIMVTGNRREDQSGASTLPAHFRNSTLLVSYSPDFQGWEKWYYSQGFDSVIPAFLAWKPAHFSRHPRESDGVGAFATPRSWAMLAQILPALEEKEISAVASGLVGSGVALEFDAFRRLRKSLVSPEEVIRDPEKALPEPEKVLDSVDKIIALMTGMGEVAARLSAERGSKRNCIRFLVALQYISRSSREYISLAFSSFTSAGGRPEVLIDAAVEGAATDSRVQEISNSITLAFGGEG
jgi:hypothetical protein